MNVWILSILNSKVYHKITPILTNHWLFLRFPVTIYAYLYSAPNCCQFHEFIHSQRISAFYTNGFIAFRSQAMKRWIFYWNHQLIDRLPSISQWLIPFYLFLVSFACIGAKCRVTERWYRYQTSVWRLDNIILVNPKCKRWWLGPIHMCTGWW